MDFNTQTYEKSKQEQEEFNNKNQQLHEEHEEKKHKIFNKYWTLERKLNSDKYAEEHKADDEHNKKIEALKNKRQEADQKQQEFKRIVAFIDILKKTEPFNKDDFGVYVYDYPKDEKGEIKRVLKGNCWSFPKKEKVFLKPIDTLHEDEHLKLNVYIGDNDKPKNKKSLFVVGKTSLMSNHYESSVIKLPRDYGIKTHTENDHIRHLLKDFPNEKTALVYYEKNKEKILKDFIAEHKKAVAELEEVKKNTNTKEWQILYLEDKKRYYTTSFSNYKEEENYKNVIRQLESLKGDL